MDSLNLIFCLYVATVVVALGVSLFQLYYEKKHVYKYSIYFWLTISLSLAMNILSHKFNITSLTVSGLGTFLSQLVLAYVISQILKVKFNSRPYILLFLVACICAETLPLFKNNLTYYILLLSLVETWPALHVSIKALSNRNIKKTSSQILLISFTLLMSVHYLDYAFLIKNQSDYLLGLILAFFLLHSISALIPMAINEIVLQAKNENLESEVKSRVEALRKADLQIWSNSRLSTIGHFAGIIAHEINTPLSTISISSQYILNKLDQPEINTTKLSEKIKTIKASALHIADMTNQLKTVAGDQVNNKITIVLIEDILKNLKRAMSEVSIYPTLNVQNLSPSKTFPILAQELDIEHILRNIIHFFCIDHNFSVQQFKILHISTQIIESNVEIKFSLEFNDPMTSFERLQSEESPINLSFIVAKSLVEKNNGILRYEPINHQIEIKFPLYNRQNTNIISHGELNNHGF